MWVSAGGRIRCKLPEACVGRINYSYSHSVVWSVSHSVISNPLRLHGLSIEFSSKNTWGVAIPFSRKSSRPRDRTHVFWIAGRFFTIWANRVVQCHSSIRRQMESICCSKRGAWKMCGGCTVPFQSLRSNRIDVFLRLCQYRRVGNFHRMPHAKSNILHTLTSLSLMINFIFIYFYLFGSVGSWLWHVESLVAAHELLDAAYRI